MNKHAHQREHQSWRGSIHPAEAVSRHMVKIILLTLWIFSFAGQAADAPPLAKAETALRQATDRFMRHITNKEIAEASDEMLELTILV